MATITQRKSGGWEARIRAKGYPSQSKVFDTQKAAQAWSKVVESEMVRGVFVNRAEAENTTLLDALDRYSKEVTVNKKGSKQELVRIGQWKVDKLARRSLASLQPKDFVRWRDDRLKCVSASTVVKDLALVSHVFSIADREWGIHLANPIRSVGKPRVDNARDRRLSEDEEKRLMSALDDCRNLFVRPMVLLAVETAMRQSEILNARWHDKGEKYIRLNDTKNGEPRNVPLSVRARQILDELPYCGIDGRMFPISQQSIIQAFVRVCERAGLKDFHFHDLRHEATSRLSERLQLHELMKVTGHKTMTMLARYYHPKTNDLADKLG